MSWAKVGMKVVCIKLGAWTYLQPDESAPSYGDVLTIRTVEFLPEGVHLSFEEVRNREYEYLDGFGECVFEAEQFRPLVTKTQSEDVAMFKRIADQVPNMEKENV